MNNHKLYLYRPGGSASDFLGELLVDNLNVNIKLHEMSTITFTIPETINNIANTRLDEVLDGYIVELWYGQVDGVYNPPSQKDFEKIRFILHKTPLDFNDFKRIYSYEGYSIESNLELRQITNWAGVFVPDFYRSITYNNSTPNQYTEVAATGQTIPNHPYIITTKSPDTGSYIKIAPTTATATPLDIYVYEVRENTDPADIRYNEIAYVRYNGTTGTPYNESGFKQGYYFLDLDANQQYVEYIYIYVPDNYDEFDGQPGAAYRKLRFKVYDNPISRHYAIGVNRNSENPFTDYYIDLAQDVEDSAPAQYGNYQFTSQNIRSKNGLKLEHALLGNIQTRDNSNNINNNSLTDDGLLYNTDFTIGTIDAIVAAKYRSNLEFNNTTVYQAIRDIAESFDAIAVFDTIAKTVSFYPENATTWPNNGLILKYGTYLKNISKDIDASKIVTAAKAVGKDNLGIELITPDGNDYWEDFSYYLDEFYIDKDLTLAELYAEGFTFTLQNPSTDVYYLGISYPDSDNTSFFESRWMDAAEAKKLAKWQFNRDFLHKVLLGEFLPSDVDGSIGVDLTPMNRFYDLYNIRSRRINEYVQSDRVLSERKAEYFRYKNLYDFYEKRVNAQVGLTGTPDPTDEQRYTYYRNLWEDAQTAVAAQETFVENQRLEIFTTTIANSIGDKLNEVRSALNKSGVFSIDLNKLKSFIKESVVTDSKIDNDFDLLEAVITHVNENKIPRITLNVGIVNILAAQESYDDWNKLRVGDLLNVYFPEFNINEEIQIREVTIDFEQHTASLVIASVRSYNKSRANYVSKSIKQLLRTNKNNLNNIEDFSRVTNTESEQTYATLNGGTINTTNTVIAFGATDSSGEYGNTISGSGGSLLVVSDVDPLTETFNFSSNKRLFILDGAIQSFYDAGTHVTQVEVSGEKGFVIRKITGSVEDADLNVVEQVYIDTNGNAVFAGELSAATGTFSGSLVVGSDAYNQVVALAGAGTTVFKAGTIEQFQAITTANLNDLLLITSNFTDIAPNPDRDYIKDDIYRYDLITAPSTYDWVLAADLKTKITGSVGGWTINATDIKSNNDTMTLHSDSNNNGVSPYISIGQASEQYEATGIFLGMVSDGEPSPAYAPKFSLVSAGDNYLKWTGEDLLINGSLGGEISAILINDITIDEQGIRAEPSTGVYSFYLNASDGTGGIGAWNFDADAIYTGTKTEDEEFTTTAGHITFGSDGHISSNQFRIDANGNAIFKGSLEAATGSFGSVTIDAAGSLTIGNTIIDNNGINAKNESDETNFSIDPETGEITSIAGQIAGWTISSTSLSSGNVSGNYLGISPGTGTGSNISFWAGATDNTAANISAAPFRVTNTGALTSTSGSIGGWTINSDGIFTGTFDESGYTETGITISNNGSIHSQNFYLDSTGITSKAGNIGGFTIGATSLTAGTAGTSVGVTTDAVAFYAGDATPGSAPFRVTNAGVLNATGADITGVIKASSGQIGSNATNKWIIGTDTTNASIHNGKTTLTDSTNAGIYIGTNGISLGTAGVTPEFSVTNAGILNASSATITGTITATDGRIGSTTDGWDINANVLESKNDYIKLDAANNKITVGADVNNNITLQGALASGDSYIGLGKTSYALSGTAGIYAGLDNGVAKLSIGNTTNSLTWDGSTLSLNGASGSGSSFTNSSLSIGQTTSGFDNNGIFLGLVSTSPRISLRKDASTFFRYNPDNVSPNFNLEIGGNAKVGPLNISNVGQSSNLSINFATNTFTSSTLTYAGIRNQNSSEIFSNTFTRRSINTFTVSYSMSSRTNAPLVYLEAVLYNDSTIISSTLQLISGTSGTAQFNFGGTVGTRISLRWKVKIYQNDSASINAAVISTSSVAVNTSNPVFELNNVNIYNSNAFFSPRVMGTIGNFNTIGLGKQGISSNLGENKLVLQSVNPFIQISGAEFDSDDYAEYQILPILKKTAGPVSNTTTTFTQINALRINNAPAGLYRFELSGDYRITLSGTIFHNGLKIGVSLNDLNYQTGFVNLLGRAKINTGTSNSGSESVGTTTGNLNATSSAPDRQIVFNQVSDGSGNINVRYPFIIQGYITIDKSWLRDSDNDSSIQIFFAKANSNGGTVFIDSSTLTLTKIS